MKIFNIIKIIKTYFWMSVKLLWASLVFLLPAVQWIWIDDKSGKRSDTTMWQNLAGFPLYATIWIGAGILYKRSNDLPPSEWFEISMPFMYFLAGILGLTVVAYGTKRFRERAQNEINDRQDDDHPQM